MPNTNPPILSEENLALEQSLAKAGARCDYALIFGASATNAELASEIAFKGDLVALKMYLNDTFGQLCMPNVSDWIKHFESWPRNLPICVHAEGQTTAAVILLASLYQRSVHVCHVAREEEILIIKAAKERGVQVTCEVCPHHLFLSEKDILRIGERRSKVKPPLMTLKDQQALWENIDVVDIFATDHAPHTGTIHVYTKHFYKPNYSNFFFSCRKRKRKCTSGISWFGNSVTITTNSSESKAFNSAKCSGQAV